MELFFSRFLQVRAFSSARGGPWSKRIILGRLRITQRRSKTFCDLPCELGFI